MILSFSLSSKAQMINPSNTTNAAANTVVAALSSFSRNDVSSDTISGACTFKDGSCNGAEISLYKNDQRVFVTTLTSLNGFKIPNLKKKESYILKLSWSKHNLIQTKKVETGEFVDIRLNN